MPERVPADPSLALASVFEREGRLDAAIDVLRRLVSQEPASFEARMSLGSLLSITGEVHEAVAVFSDCVTLRPSSCDAYLNLAATKRSIGDLAGALTAVERALALDPESWSAHHNLGAILDAAWEAASHGAGDALDAGDAGRADGADAVDDAARAYGRAAELEPRDPRPPSALGSLLLRAGRLRDSLAACDEAIRRRDTLFEAHHNRAVCLQRLGYERAAIAAFRRAVALRPDSWVSRNNLGMLRLKRGQFADGFREFEWRFQNGGEPAPRVGRPQPVWRGESLDGQCLLLCAEQGFGDQMQFVRFARGLRGFGARKVLIESASSLAPLISTCPGIDAIVDPNAPCDEADFQLPLLSLPTRVGFDLATVGADVPYLFPVGAIPEEVDRGLAADRFNQFTVGIVWTGDPKNPLNTLRSCSPEDFAPLARIPRVQLVSVQHDDAGVDPARLRDLGIVPLGRLIGDFAQTASIFGGCLDLLISVDTMTVHLAGALGVPVWTLLPFPCDWRWLTRRDDSPWYPTMRLFRQRRGEMWPVVLRRVEACLRERIVDDYQIQRDRSSRSCRSIRSSVLASGAPSK